MRIMKVKRIIFFLLVIGIMVVVSGCARWPDGPGPGPGEPEYQLEITVEVAGVINSDDGIYYIVLDADEESIDGPGDDVEDWEDDFYYVKLDGMGFHFARVEEGSASMSLTDSSYSEDKLQVTIALSDLGSPSSIDTNVITTNLDNNTYDHLDSYFTISNVFGSTETRSDSSGDSGEGGIDFDIVKVTAVVTTLY
ncbi:unnamed protein product [marine sediment metagenome]|uniref:DUF4382 domain-containing protein n=1 Tax=marine sediment metagenome TaxID=412755 RepID=X0RRU9_9ZZZZ